jgi:predicted nucleic acid-binding protein
MDKIVVDANVAIKWFVTEPLSAQARKFLDGYESDALVLHTPDLINAEVGNVVWKKHRFQGLTLDDAQQVIDEFRKLTIALTPTGELLNEAFRLAVAHGRTVYDSLYLALSLREQCPYITADERLANALRANFPNVIWLADWA